MRRPMCFEVSVCLHLLGMALIVFLLQTCQVIPTIQKKAVSQVIPVKLLPNKAPQPKTPNRSPANRPPEQAAIHKTQIPPPSLLSKKLVYRKKKEVEPLQVKLSKGALYPELKDPDGVSEKVLITLNASLAFASPEDPQHFIAMYASPRWNDPVSLANVSTDKDDHCSYRSDGWPVAKVIVRRQGRPESTIVYVVFPDEVCTGFQELVKNKAASKGYHSACSAIAIYDTSSPVGVTITDVSECVP